MRSIQGSKAPASVGSPLLVRVLWLARSSMKNVDSHSHAASRVAILMCGVPKSQGCGACGSPALQLSSLWEPRVLVMCQTCWQLQGCVMRPLQVTSLVTVFAFRPSCSRRISRLFSGMWGVLVATRGTVIMLDSLLGVACPDRTR